ncbi:MAG: hypothetical protein AAF528_07615 [Cyanobacteria bacterium P01_C01_bin.121]
MGGGETCVGVSELLVPLDGDGDDVGGVLRLVGSRLLGNDEGCPWLL